MTDLQDQVAAARQAVEQAQTALARYHAQQETSQAQLDASLAALQTEFGVSTVEEAEAKLEQLQAEALALTTDIQNSLRSASPDGNH